MHLQLQLFAMYLVSGTKRSSALAIAAYTFYFYQPVPAARIENLSLQSKLADSYRTGRGT
jgi:hypothetical protein